MKIIILAPHTDDGEFGCGGTIAKLIENKYQVFYVAFSSGTANGKELMAAMNIFKKIQFDHLNFETRRFNENRQEILDYLLNIKTMYRPDIVFLPCAEDIHQDHQVIYQEGLRAFRDLSMFGYELPWNHLTFKTQCFYILKPEHIEKKIAAIKKYKSQCHRRYSSPDFIKSWAKTRGMQIGVEYAETFEVIRCIQ